MAAIGLAVLLLIVGVAVWVGTRARPEGPRGEPTAAPTVAAVAIGPVDGCRAGPRFQSALGLGPRAALVTALTDVKGLAVLDPDGNEGRGRVYQHATWDDAGFLGPFITDRHGHIYTAPVPLVSLVDNPPEQQNRIYRVDSDTQQMALYVELPWAQPPSGANPFGVVGLAYDCETESLYASSLAGSTAREEVGRLFRVDLTTGQVAAHYDGVDAMGVAVFNGADGKRLYYGLARRPEVWSVGLDAAGNFVGEPRLEFSYAQHVAGGRRTARRIRFQGGDTMVLNLMDFNYTLQVAGQRREDLLFYRYDPAAARWEFVRFEVAQ